MEHSAAPTATTVRIAVLADDLIWASRLRAAVTNSGAEPVIVRRADEIATPFAAIDLGGRSYDGIAAVKAAVSAGATVLAVGQHDDIATRKAALAAGAKRVLSYNKLFSDGPNVFAKLIAGTL